MVDFSFHCACFRAQSSKIQCIDTFSKLFVFDIIYEIKLKYQNTDKNIYIL